MADRFANKRPFGGAKLATISLSGAVRPPKSPWAEAQGLEYKREIRRCKPQAGELVGGGWAEGSPGGVVLAVAAWGWASAGGSVFGSGCGWASN